MTYCALDTETTMRGGYGRKPNPFIDKILTIGLKYQKKGLFLIAGNELHQGWLEGVTVLVGHNLKFDLLFIWNNLELRKAFMRGLTIWDTQLAEYILSGQRHKYPALRDIAVNKYGCQERNKHIEGKNTEEVPIELLLEDVRNDVLDTEQVMLGQLKVAKTEGMLKLIKQQMEALLCTTEMEYNGVRIDVARLDVYKKSLEDESRKLQDATRNVIKKYWTV